MASYEQRMAGLTLYGAKRCLDINYGMSKNCLLYVVRSPDIDIDYMATSQNWLVGRHKELIRWLDTS
jgi:hypothetical protein